MKATGARGTQKSETRGPRSNSEGRHEGKCGRGKDREREGGVKKEGGMDRERMRGAKDGSRTSKHRQGEKRAKA